VVKKRIVAGGVKCKRIQSTSRFPCTRDDGKAASDVGEKGQMGNSD